MRRITHTIGLGVALAAFALAPAAHAASGGWQQAIRDCAYDGRLHQHYSQSDLLQALHHLPPDVSEYTDCADVLRSALASPGGGSGSGGAGGGSAPPVTPTPSDLNQLQGLEHGHAPKLSIGGHTVSPAGAVRLASRTAANQLPGSLVGTLIALAAMTALAGIIALRHRFPGMRRFALRVLRR